MRSGEHVEGDVYVTLAERQPARSTADRDIAEVISECSARDSEHTGRDGVAEPERLRLVSSGAEAASVVT